MSFCDLLEAPAAMVTSLKVLGKPENIILQLANRAERKFNNASFLNGWNQYVLINLIKT